MKEKSTGYVARENVSEAHELSALSANFPVDAPITLTRGDVTRERGFTCVGPGFQNRIRIDVPLRGNGERVTRSLNPPPSLSLSLLSYRLSRINLF